MSYVDTTKSTFHQNTNPKITRTLITEAIQIIVAILENTEKTNERLKIHPLERIPKNSQEGRKSQLSSNTIIDKG